MHRLPHLSLTQVRLVRLFTLLLVFTVLVLYGVFRSSRFQELLRRRTERLLTAKIGRTVTIGSFDLALVPFAFLVRDVAVANDRRGLAGPAFSASEIELRGLPTITSRRIDIPKLRVVSPRVVVEVFPDGTTNLKPVLEALAGGGGGGVDVRLKEAVIQRATLRFREWDAEIDAVLQDAAITARAGPQPYGDPPRARVPQGALQAGEQRDTRLRDRRGGDARAGTRAPDGTEAARRPAEVRGFGRRRRSQETRPRSRRARRDDRRNACRRYSGSVSRVTGGVAMRGTMRFGEPGGFRIFGAFDLAARRVRAVSDDGRGPDSRGPEGPSRERDARELRGRNARGPRPARADQEPAASGAHRAARARPGLRAVLRRPRAQGDRARGTRRPRHDPHVRARRNRARGRDRADPPDGRCGTALGGHGTVRAARFRRRSPRGPRRAAPLPRRAVRDGRRRQDPRRRRAAPRNVGARPPARDRLRRPRRGRAARGQLLSRHPERAPDAAP